MNTSFSIFDLMGVEPPKDFLAKDEIPKKAEKKATKKATKKKTKAVSEFKLPITVNTGYYEPLVVTKEMLNVEKDTITEKELQKYIDKDNTLIEFNSKHTVYDFNGNSVFLTFKESSCRAKGTITLTGKTICKIGNISFDLSSLLTSEQTEVQLSEIEKFIATSFPLKHMTFIEHDDLLIPVFIKDDFAKPLSCPIKICVLGRENIMINQEDVSDFLSNIEKKKRIGKSEEDENVENEEEEDTTENNKKGKVTSEVVGKMVIQRYPEFEGRIKLQYSKEMKMVFISMDAKNSTPNKKEVLYDTSYILSLLFTRIQLSPELFNGEEYVTENEIFNYLKTDYPEYTKKRGASCDIDEENKMIIMTLGGTSKRGANYYPPNEVEITNSALSKDYALFETKYLDTKVRIEKTSMGLFAVPKEKLVGDSGFSGFFEYYLPKVPYEIFNSCLGFFNYITRNYDTEAALHLYYDTEKRVYFLDCPKQKVFKEYLEIYGFNYVDRRYILVADIHSHGILPAEFSELDNEYENGTRLYMLFGNLKGLGPIGTPYCDFTMRAGSAGYFAKNVPMHSVFEPANLRNMAKFPSIATYQKWKENLIFG